MRKLFLNSVIVIAMGSASFAGYAAESASLSVTGTITPATCGVTLSAASIDLGNIAASTLTQKANTKLGSDITVNVACDAPAAVAVQTTDNRASSAITVAEAHENMELPELPEQALTDANIFGLGTDSANNNVGILMLGITGATVDGSSNPHLLSSLDRASWTATSVANSSGLTLTKDGYFASASAADATSPVAFTNATYTISSGVVLKKGDQYPSGESVRLDGNVTFSVVYL